MNKYEQLIEFIINEDEQSARDLFHSIVVGKSREIYESLMDEETVEEVGGNEVDSLLDEITCDEEGMSEDEFGGEDEMSVDGGEESEFDFDASGELDSHEEDHASDEDRIQDLEDAFDELKAEFDSLLAQEEGEGHDMDAIQGAGEEGGEEEFGGEETEEFAESKEEDEEDDEEVEESKSQDSVDVMREYVEKVGNIYGGKGDAAEGAEVAAGKSVAVNKGSIVAGKNDMGGSTANIVKGGTEGNPDGKQYSKPSNQYSKGAGEIKSGNINVPGGKAGSSFKTKQSPKQGEGNTTDGKLPVNPKSLSGGKVR